VVRASTEVPVTTVPTGKVRCPNNGICNTFDYDSGWGIYLQNTSNVTIDNASANADDTGGYILDGASNVTIER
jgi:hypothetical protein